MNEIKNILFPIIILIILSSCTNSPSNDTSNSDTIDTSRTLPVDSIVCTPDSTVSDLEMTLKPQEQNFWCWAACAEMVMEHLSDTDTITQCVEANKQFGREDCCSSPTSDSCDRPGWPQFEKYGYDADTTFDEALSWEDVKKQIDCKKSPFCVTWKWDEGGGHMMVASAYKKIDEDSLVKIYDPLPVGTGTPQWVRYSEYVSGPGYTHWDDFFNIKKR